LFNFGYTWISIDINHKIKSMKRERFISLAFVVLSAGVIFQSCSKEDELISTSGQPSWSVRPDFATIDERPQEVIALYQVSEKDTKPVELTSIKTAPGKYALVIGISDYKGTRNDLTYCDDDAIDWGKRLVAAGYRVISLLDLKATKSAIETEVNNLAALSVAGNEIALCYSGHGSKGNIISTDLYYITSTWLKTKFANSTSTKMMFCFDACQIGAMSTDLNAPGRVIVVASNKTSLSYDGDETMKNGVFTYYQMMGFQAPLNYVYLESDSKYACEQMIIWGQTNRIRVVPSYLDSYTGDYELPL
jgi:hypothetical protein